MISAKSWWQGLLLIALLLPFPLHTKEVPVFDYESFKCILLNIYHEARGEPVVGKEAITQVVLNRMRQQKESACSIIYKPYQFSWTTGKHDTYDDLKNRPGFRAVSTQLWARLVRGVSVAPRPGDRHAVGVVGQLPLPFYFATHYHAKSVNPKWNRKMKRLGVIGNHIFYTGRFL